MVLNVGVSHFFARWVLYSLIDPFHTDTFLFSHTQI